MHSFECIHNIDVNCEYLWMRIPCHFNHCTLHTSHFTLHIRYYSATMQHYYLRLLFRIVFFLLFLLVSNSCIEIVCASAFDLTQFALRNPVFDGFLSLSLPLLFCVSRVIVSCAYVFECQNQNHRIGSESGWYPNWHFFSHRCQKIEWNEFFIDISKYSAWKTIEKAYERSNNIK